MSQCVINEISPVNNGHIIAAHQCEPAAPSDNSGEGERRADFHDDGCLYSELDGPAAEG